MIRNTLWLISSFVTGKVVASVWQLYLARYFTDSPEIYGYYRLLLTQYAVWIIVAEGSITYAVQQFIASDKNNLDRKIWDLWPFVVGGRVLLGLLSAMIFMVLTGLQYPMLIPSVFILSVTLVVYAIGTAPLGLWAGMADFRPEAKASILCMVTFIGLAVIAINITNNIVFLILCSFFSALAQGIYLWHRALRKWGVPRGIAHSVKIEGMKFLRFCVPLTISAFVFRFFFMGDMMVITNVLGPEAAGVYSISLMLFFLVANLTWSQFGKAYTPVLIANWNSNNSKVFVSGQLRQILSFYAFVNICLIIGTGILGRQVMTLVFGSGSPWVGATEPFLWLLLSFLPAVMYALL